MSDQGTPHDIGDSGAVAGRDVTVQGTYAAGRDIVLQYGTGPVQTVVLEQLPAATAHFTDRIDVAAEMERVLSESLADPAATTPLPIVTISGKPGVGKTTLAVYIAYRVRAHYPDGQLYVDLRAGDAQPLQPQAVLAELPARISRPTRTAGRGCSAPSWRAGRSSWCSTTRPVRARSGR